MALVEIGLICLTLMGVSGIGAIAYYLAKLAQQQGITEREQLKQAAIMARAGNSPESPSYSGKKWWETVLEKLLENPQIQESIMKFAMEKMVTKKE